MILSEIQDRMSKLDNWGLESGTMLSKDFIFDSFKRAMNFVNQVAEVVERVNHFPSILIDKTIVRVVSVTHGEHGLTSKDFDLAEEIDKIGK
ncbi:4a-hydroxytetrahydrobiopterin dehydratase [Candidatus Pacearchaeota archaeon CG10_big_fil_rev_8_21_14_0_10_31_24]|nr:MAG: 4a-hydroxytetrahydrobiopterin dehydratase [Candidatus Pacearchaeota archaeon CG10_big_fil_rev_8_21_14_0_10_31_24]